MSTVANVMSDFSTSITSFKANPNMALAQSGGEAVAVLKSNAPYFYAVPPKLYEMMLETLEDASLLLQANARLRDGKQPIAVNLDEL